MNEIAALMDKDMRTRKHGTDNADVLSSSSRDQRNAESFIQIIYNLEGLLREALKMAQEATEKRDFTESRARKLEHEFVGAEKADGLQIRLGSIPPTSMPTYLNCRSDYGGTVENPSLEIATLNQGNGVAMAPNLINQDAQFVPKTEPQTSQNGKQANNSVKTGDESSGWNVAWKHRPKPSANRQPSRPAPLAPRLPETPSQERRILVSREVKQSSQLASREDVRQHIQTRHEPPIQPRLSSLRLRGQQSAMERPKPVDVEKQHSSDSDYHIDPEKDFEPIRPGYRQSTAVPVRQSSSQMQDFGQGKENDDRNSGRHSHFIIRDHHHFSLSHSHRRAPIARNWSTTKKRWVATVTCLSTMLLGFVIGIYTDEVPAIQYTIFDEHHCAILGNVVLFLGLALYTVLFWPLPILHGRKPYTLGALIMLLALQFPQAMVLSRQRSPSNASYRAGLLISRAFSGFFLGFASINFKGTLLDLFGASLQSSNPHQEVVDSNDVRRHGGCMGLWLGIWTWSFIGSIGVGFLIGAAIISGLTVSWGFWTTIIMTAAMLLINVLVPEVRRSAYRRSVSEIRNGQEVSRRVAKGEIKMHLDATGPVVWYEEVFAGYQLMSKMLIQSGFTSLALYTAWIYGQLIMIVVVSQISLPSSIMITFSSFWEHCCLGITASIRSMSVFVSLRFQSARYWLSRSRKPLSSVGQEPTDPGRTV